LKVRVRALCPARSWHGPSGGGCGSPPLALCGPERGGSGMLDPSPPGTSVAGREALLRQGLCFYYHVVGLVMTSWASLGFSGNWLAARTPRQICSVKLSRVHCRAEHLTENW
jgi:hypothetical protein